MKKYQWDFDCAIIGGGPAGLIAALYLARFCRNIVIFNKGIPRVTYAPKIHNLIGHDHGISGVALLKKIHTQLYGYPNVKRVNQSTKVSRIKNGFQLTTRDHRRFTAKKVILATGIKDEQPRISNWKQLRNCGSFRYCSICDGFEMKDEPIAVFAGDDSGIQKGLFLCQWTKEVTILVPKDFKPSALRLKEIKKSGVRLLCCSSIQVKSDSRKKGLRIKVNQQAPFFCKVAYVELGASVNDDAFSSLKKLRRVKAGYIEVGSEQRTSIPGLFAAGDCVHQIGQVSIAAAQGAIAAITVHNDLLE